MIYLANDKYRAILRTNWIDSPPDGSISVSAVPDNVPTLVVVGWNTDFETVFSVQGKTGTGFSSYALTGVTRLRGYDGVIPEGTSVNCLNNMEFINQYLTYLGIEWKGAWDVETAYLAGEGVSHEGSSYIALVDDTGTEPPDAGVWQLVTQRGASWSHGTGVPSDANGQEGDFYINTSNDDVYVRGASTWSLLVNIKGEQGIQGIQGIQGEAATITVGTVTAGAPGSSVIITNVGDENDAVFDITIPEGEKGETGETGAQGIQGIQGVTGETGASITSAAFVSDDLVFTKDDASTVTLVDAKTDLRGEQGIQGEQGVQGNPGLGVPAGGDAGQVLTKVSGADNDTTWTDQSGGGDFLVMQVFS